MWKDFKAFLMRGNVIDLATAVVIGAAFGKIVTALVDNIIMPCIGMLTSGVDFANMKYVLKEGTLNAEGVLEGDPPRRRQRLLREQRHGGLGVG